jgi:hypothetical protein
VFWDGAVAFFVPAHVFCGDVWFWWRIGGSFRLEDEKGEGNAIEKFSTPGSEVFYQYQL